MALVQTDSPTYQRRLVRELNSQENGFYTPTGRRCNLAKFTQGRVAVREIGGKWFFPDYDAPANFCDAYGRGIYASRVEA